MLFALVYKKIAWYIHVDLMLHFFGFLSSNARFESFMFLSDAYSVPFLSVLSRNGLDTGIDYSIKFSISSLLLECLGRDPLVFEPVIVVLHL